MELALAIDVGGTKCAVGLVTRAGELIDRVIVHVDHRDNADELFDEIARAVEAQMIRAREHHGAQPLVVGVGSAGPITHNVETVSPINIPQWREFPLRSRLQALTGLPVFGDGDAKALALAEGWLGAAKGVDNFMAMVATSLSSPTDDVVLKLRLLDQPSKPLLGAHQHNPPMRLWCVLGASWAGVLRLYAICLT